MLFVVVIPNFLIKFYLKRYILWNQTPNKLSKSRLYFYLKILRRSELDP
jgi:hypothetical protein